MWSQACLHRSRDTQTDRVTLLNQVRTFELLIAKKLNIARSEHSTSKLQYNCFTNSVKKIQCLLKTLIEKVTNLIVILSLVYIFFMFC